MVERRLPLVNKPQTFSFDDPNISLMERWRLYKTEKKDKGIASRLNKWFMRSLVIFQILTQIYVFLTHVLPYYFLNYDPSVLYFSKVVVTYFGVMILANWCLVILVDTSYEKTKDSPYLRVSYHDDQTAEHFSARIQQAASKTNGGINYQYVCDISDDGESLPRHYCEKCDMEVPYRVHHCSVCKKCITKKDHHCYIIGTCVGYKNERYFIVVNFHTVILGLVGGCMTAAYIYSVILAELSSVVDLIIPVTFIRCLFGYLSGWNCLIITQLYLEFLFGFMCLAHFMTEINLNRVGKTNYEEQKKLSVRNSNTFNQNMRSVFGDFWGLNFIVPMTLVFRQNGDGCTWTSVKITSKK